MTVIDTIRERRETMNLPLRVLAETIEIDVSTWGKIEKGERTLKVGMLQPICEILNLETKKITVQYWAERLEEELAEEQYANEILTETKKRLKK